MFMVYSDEAMLVVFAAVVVVVVIVDIVQGEG
jgi:hypothetical protein